MWLLGAFDVSFGVGGRFPLEDYAHFAGYGIGGEMGFRYFFTDMLGVGIKAGGYYHFQRRFKDSLPDVWYDQNFQMNQFPASFNLIMKFYLAEGVNLMVSVGGGGHYTLYFYKRRVGVYDTASGRWTITEEEDDLKGGSYLLNFEAAFRMTDFDVFTGVNIVNTPLNEFSFTDREGVESVRSLPVFYIGVRYFLKFGV